MCTLLNLNTTMVQIYAEKDITSVQLNILSRNCTLLYLMTKQFRTTPSNHFLLLQTNNFYVSYVSKPHHCKIHTTYALEGTRYIYNLFLFVIRRASSVCVQTGVHEVVMVRTNTICVTTEKDCSMIWSLCVRNCIGYV